MANPPSRLAIAAPHDPPAGVGQIDLHPATRAALNVLSLGAYQHPAAAGDYWKAQAQAYNPLHPAGAVNAATLFMGRMTPAQEGFLRAINETSYGSDTRLGDFSTSVEDLAHEIGGAPLGAGIGDTFSWPRTGESPAYNPLTVHNVPRWLDQSPFRERGSIAGMVPGSIRPGSVQRIVGDTTLETGVSEYQQALINYLRNVGEHVGGIKPGTEGN